MFRRMTRALAIALAALALLFPTATPALAIPPAAVHAVIEARALAPLPVHVLAPTAVTASTPLVAFTVDPAAIVQLVLAVFLPILVGLVTTRVTSAATKAWLLAALTLVTSLVTELARAIDAGVTFDAGRALIVAIPAFAISVATHYGLWKPTGVATTVQDLGPQHRA